jgi:hypothetical protein
MCFFESYTLEVLARRGWYLYVGLLGTYSIFALTEYH